MFQHVWIILLPPSWTELCCSQIWSRRRKFLAGDVWGRQGLLKTLQKVQRKSKTFVSRLAFALTDSSTSLAIFFWMHKWTKLKNTWPKIFFAEGSILPSELTFLTSRGQSCTWACGSGLVQLRSHFWTKSPCFPHSPHSARTAAGSQLCKLDCSAWTQTGEALRECTKRAPVACGDVQSTERGCSWSEPPEIAAIQAQGWPHHVCHSTVCFFARCDLSVPAEPLPPPCALLLSRRQADWRCRATASLLGSGVSCFHWAALHIDRPKQMGKEGTVGDSPLLIASRGPVSSLVKALLSHFHAEWVMSVFKTSLLPFSNPELNLAFLILLF